MAKKRAPSPASLEDDDYQAVLTDVADLLESARRAAARSVNTVMTVTYWKVGRRVVEHEQRGQKRAVYGERLIERLSGDLTKRFGRGYGKANLKQMRRFYLEWGDTRIGQTPSGQFAKGFAYPTLPSEFPEVRFPLSWSHYVSLLSVDKPEARSFYESESLRGGWTARQLIRQIGSQFYERTMLSRNKAAMLTKGQKARPEDEVTPEEEIKDPLVLEFLDLKDEYSESDLEEGLIRHLEAFLLELGDDFTFVGRQKRLRVDDEWFRIDLVFFHRRLRCLVLIDLKLASLTAGDVGQMNLYLNYARHHWTREGENPPVGLILCAKHRAGVARYALEGLSSKVLAAEYRTALPSEETLAAELESTRKAIEQRAKHSPVEE
jgi:predicted nuclease of restriction endonuclease-like (RecB) superfamily